MDQQLVDAPRGSREAFYRQRIQKLGKVHRRLQTILPLVEKALK
jgi:hypothetical protein